MTSAALRRREGAPAPARRRSAARTREALTGYGFVAPNMLLMALFLFVPILWAIQLSFQDSRGFGTPEWVGFANYLRMGADPVFWQSLANTLLFTAVTVPIELIGGLGLAVLLNSVLPARGVYRTIIVLPLVISGVASGMIAVTIFSESSGIVNKVLTSLGASPVSWQSEGAPAMISVMITAIWLRIGFNMVIYIAGLQSVSPELYEAARIDGATRWQQFRALTVPLVGPSTFFLLIMNVIASFQVFDIVFVMTGGGPGFATSVLGTYAYRNGFQVREQGYGAALGVVILLITLLFTYVQWRTSRTRDLVE
ncbi:MULTISPECIES: carbohydrate ABC transporter permease [Rathayibacter]|jgi:multiple sugar transport system permease protein|uniref:carbohydrate ABC transporter permease n=1 Tax=Rathayibacter TaxID=33886 RepID=UPI001E31065A|nr:MULTISPECIES: sugar ABC transporter permease [Rathayibacter]MCJ1696895.1 sugar ABC transporter permease [Rathayibacter caricis]